MVVGRKGTDTSAAHVAAIQNNLKRARIAKQSPAVQQVIAAQDTGGGVLPAKEFGGPVESAQEQPLGAADKFRDGNVEFDPETQWPSLTDAAIHALSSLKQASGESIVHSDAQSIIRTFSTEVADWNNRSPDDPDIQSKFLDLAETQAVEAVDRVVIPVKVGNLHGEQRAVMDKNELDLRAQIHAIFTYAIAYKALQDLYGEKATPSPHGENLLRTIEQQSNAPDTSDQALSEHVTTVGVSADTRSQQALESDQADDLSSTTVPQPPEKIFEPQLTTPAY